LRWLYLYLPLLVVLLLAGSLAWVWFRFDSIHRLDLGDALAPASGQAVNYLLVGSDSREGIDSTTPNVGAIGTSVSGRRSDTIIVLRIEGGKATMMSIPRDLWATNSATGRNGRVNAAYNDGPANLVRTVRANLGIAVQHYVEVDFVTFSEMVDAIGGIDIDFPHPAYDRHSGLNIIAPGVRHLDGSQALAYVRSRHYVEVIDGQEHADPTADLGRNQRQQNFIRTVLRDVGATRNPWTLAKVVGAATTGMRVDTVLGFGDVVSLARNLSGGEPTSVVLPTRGTRKGGASVLLLDTEAARPVLAQFGGTPNAPH
jgi:LCP family protein required for cell wall assembly